MGTCPHQMPYRVYLLTIEGGDEPPATLMTEDLSLSQVQSTLATHTREMTRVIDGIGTKHVDRLYE